MTRPVATLCLLAVLAGATASENSRLDWLGGVAPQLQPPQWGAPALFDLNPDAVSSRFNNPESRYPIKYTNPFESQHISEQMTNGNRRAGTLSEGDTLTPNDRLLRMRNFPDASHIDERPVDQFIEALSDDGQYFGSIDNRPVELPVEKRLVQDETDDGYEKRLNEETYREPTEKRSAVATALNAGRRRRQPAPALGKVVTPFIGVGVLNDVGSFFDTLRDNIETVAALSPSQRASLFHDAPSVVQATAQGSSGGGYGFKKLYALRPLKPTGYIRSIKKEDVYPGANHHNPRLLWTGLGR